MRTTRRNLIKMTTYAIIFPQAAVERPSARRLKRPAPTAGASDRKHSDSRRRPCAPWSQAPPERPVRPAFPTSPGNQACRNPWWNLRRLQDAFSKTYVCCAARWHALRATHPGQSAHQPVLVIGVSRNGFAYFRRLVGGKLDQNVRERHGFGKEDAVLHRRMRVASHSLKQCGGTGERRLVAPVRQRTSGELA